MEILGTSCTRAAVGGCTTLPPYNTLEREHAGNTDTKNSSRLFGTSEWCVRGVTQIREQNPKLAKQSSVLAVSMDNVYSFATTPRDSNNAKGVVFRFMPDMRQVNAALDVRCQPLD